MIASLLVETGNPAAFILPTSTKMTSRSGKRRAGKRGTGFEQFDVLDVVPPNVTVGATGTRPSPPGVP
jgi:hypothetical protein